MRLYHGSTKPHVVGSVLMAKPRKTEFSGRKSVDGIGFEDLVDAYRPVELPSRLSSLYSVENVEDINVAGGAEDYVYAVETVGRTTRGYFDWLSEVLGLFFDGVPARASAKMRRLIAGYWSGKKPPAKYTHGISVPEVLSDGLVILERVEPVDYFAAHRRRLRAAKASRKSRVA